MRRAVLVPFVAAASVAVACSDATQPPVAGRATARAGDASLASLLIAPVERSAALANDITWSFAAGPEGAVSSNASAGLTVTIPPGALGDDVTITVTALAGRPVAYRFEPHGLRFGHAIALTQDLTLTSAGLLGALTLSGAYFATDTLQLTADGLALVSEVLGATVDPLRRTATFPAWHFSGYILASGRAEPDSSGGAQ